jgi:hypothetical protein
MPGIGYAPLTRYGIDASMQQMVQLTLANACAVDAGPTGTGATAAGTTAATGYQIAAGVTIFGTVAANSGCVLPATSQVGGEGLEITIINNGANYLTVYPSPNDLAGSGTINGVASVVLVQTSITPFQCGTPGVWYADGIGQGQAGSITTTASQGTLAAAGTSSQANSSAVTQALVNVTAAASTNGVRLPAAVAGLEIIMNGGGGGGTSFLVYPNGTDQINAGGASTPFTFTPNPSTTGPTLFFCIIAGNWLTR